MSNISENILSAMEIVAQKVISNTNFDQTVLAQIISKESNKNYKIKYQESIFTVSAIDTDNHEYKNGDQVYVLLSKTKNLILGLVPQEAVEDVEVQNSQEYIQIGSNCCGFLTSDNDYEPFQLCSYNADVNEIILYNINDGTDLIGLDQELARESITNSTSLLIGAKFNTQLDEVQQGSCNYGVLVTVKNISGAQVIYTLDVNHMDGNPFAPMAKNEYIDQFFIFNNPDGADFEQIEQISFFCVTPHKDENKIDYDLSMKELRICGMISAAQLGTYSLNIKMPRGNVFTSIDAGENTLEFIAEYRESGKKVEKDTFEYYWFKENRTVVVDSEKYHIYGGKGWELLDVEGNTLTLNGSQVFAENTLYKCVVYAAGIKVEKEFEVKSTADGLPKIEILLQGEQTLKVEISNPPVNKGSRLEWYYIFNGINVDITTDSTKNSIAYLDVDGYIHYTPQTSPIIFKCAYFYTLNEEDAIEQYLMTASYEVSAEFTLEEYSIVVNGGPQLFQYNEAGLAPQLYQTNFAIELLSIEFYYKGELQQLTDKEVIWSYPNTKTLIQFNGTGAPEKDSIRDGWNNVTVPQFSFELEKVYDITKAANSLIQVTIASREGANGWPQITKDIPITLLKQGDPGTNGSGYYCNITAEGHGHWIIGTTKSLPLKLEVFKDGANLEEDYSVTWSMLTGSSLTISQTGIVEGIFNSSNPWNVAQVKVTIGDYVLYDTYPIIATTSEDYLLAPNSGFRHVVYNADGTNPSYSRIPFALQNNKAVTWNIPSIPSTYDGDLTVDKRLVVKDTENKIYIPIHMSLNRYEHAWLNDWDGNTLKINEQGNYILAPQIGAGVKNGNAFTGITMGTYKQGTDSEVGLFGFANGVRSIFLDANTGNAVFGKQDNSQITLNAESGTITATNITLNGGVITWGEGKETNIEDIPTSITDANSNANNALNAANGAVNKTIVLEGKLNTTSNNLANLTKAVNFKTIVGGNYIISPYIGGGSLQLNNENDTIRVVMDPRNQLIDWSNISTGSSGTEGKGIALAAFKKNNGKWEQTFGIGTDGNATFSGTITGSTIKGSTIQNNSGTFKVDSGGNITGANIKGSSFKAGTSSSKPGILNINDKFIVTEDGNVTITSGSISWGSIIDPPPIDETGVKEDQVGPLAKTYIDAGNVISPNIEGGYLKIYNNKAGVTIDPNKGTVFSVRNSSGTEVIGLDTKGNATFTGRITATEGEIGGFDIVSGDYGQELKGKGNNSFHIRPLAPDTETTLSIGNYFSVIGRGNVYSHHFATTSSRNSYFSTENQITCTGFQVDYEGNVSSDKKITANIFDLSPGGTLYFNNSSSRGYLSSTKLDIGSAGQFFIMSEADFNNGLFYNNPYWTLHGDVIAPSSTRTNSDINKKHTISPLSLIYSNIFDKLYPVSYKYNDGRSDRTHTGFIAQHVEQAVLDCGLTTKDFAAVCYDLDEEGNKVDYRIRYEELIALCVDQIQKLKARVSELETQIQN